MKATWFWSNSLSEYPLNYKLRNGFIPRSYPLFWIPTLALSRRNLQKSVKCSLHSECHFYMHPIQFKNCLLLSYYFQCSLAIQRHFILCFANGFRIFFSNFSGYIAIKWVFLCYLACLIFFYTSINTEFSVDSF